MPVSIIITIVSSRIKTAWIKQRNAKIYFQVFGLVNKEKKMKLTNRNNRFSLYTPDTKYNSKPPNIRKKQKSLSLTGFLSRWNKVLRSRVLLKKDKVPKNKDILYKLGLEISAKKR